MLGAVLIGAWALVGAVPAQVGAQAYPLPFQPSHFPSEFAPGGGCGSSDTGRLTCYFDTQATAGDPADPGTITISIAEPSDAVLTGAYAADRAGDVCGITAGAGTQTLMLTCPTGLEAFGTGSVTFDPDTARVTVDYSPGAVGQLTGPGPTTQRLYFSSRPYSFQVDPGTAGASTVPAGWNLVGGPSGWNLQAEPDLAPLPSLLGSFYTYQAGDSDYEIIPVNVPLLAGIGVWAHLSSPMPVLQTPGSFLVYVTIPLPPNHWVMIGNPGLGPARVAGADVVYTYDSQKGTYMQSTTLGPGQGAWAWSTNGGAVTVSTFCPPLPQSCPPNAGP